MDPENRQRISIYMDKSMVEKADQYQKMAECNSRNEFVAKAIENYIADLNLKNSDDIICDKLANAIEKAIDFQAVKISKGLFRYAVELEVILGILAQVSNIEPKDLESLRKEAINNVRRTRGKVRLDDLFLRKNTDSL